ncbi:hypothetical protein HRI_000773400 [Hibiscus trionum]|uniref:Uncharacterized protein n=1 Tax=Hibiscus trionum TaxID=183268 RepID=A0A9W7H5F5_HIBTR|nr:hypothetical protein HRI_000773400 [Hibiscus trionum]
MNLFPFSVQDVGPRGRIRIVEQSTSNECKPPQAPLDKGKTAESSANAEPNPPLDPMDKGKAPVTSAQDSGNLNEGDAASFADLPIEETNNNDEVVGEESSDLPPTNADPKLPQKVPLHSRVISPQPLNTIYPVQVDLDGQDDGKPNSTAQHVRKLDEQLTSAPAPIPIPLNRGTKRCSPIHVVLQPKKSRPTPSPTSKAGMSSGKNSPAAADAQPRRGK